MQGRLSIALVLITHDLGVVARMADRVMVMYAGRSIEEADASSFFANPRHPYSLGLFASMPTRGQRKTRLKEIPGMVPGLRETTAGCAFAPRCDRAVDRCRMAVPPLVPIEASAAVACYVVADTFETAGQAR